MKLGEQVTIRGKTGTIVYIHPKFRFATVRFEFAIGGYCESFQIVRNLAKMDAIEAKKGTAFTDQEKSKILEMVKNGHKCSEIALEIGRPVGSVETWLTRNLKTFNIRKAKKLLVNQNA